MALVTVASEITNDTSQPSFISTGSPGTFNLIPGITLRNTKLPGIYKYTFIVTGAAGGLAANNAIPGLPIVYQGGRGGVVTASYDFTPTATYKPPSSLSLNIGKGGNCNADNSSGGGLTQIWSPDYTTSVALQSINIIAGGGGGGNTEKGGDACYQNTPDGGDGTSSGLADAGGGGRVTTNSDGSYLALAGTCRGRGGDGMGYRVTISTNVIGLSGQGGSNQPLVGHGGGGGGGASTNGNSGAGGFGGGGYNAGGQGGNGGAKKGCGGGGGFSSGAGGGPPTTLFGDGSGGGAGSSIAFGTALIGSTVSYNPAPSTGKYGISCLDLNGPTQDGSITIQYNLNLLTDKTLGPALFGFLTNNTTVLTSLNSIYGTIDQWATSPVKNMSGLFSVKTNPNFAFFNTDITKWDTTNVTDMSDMFNGASALNQNIGSMPQITIYPTPLTTPSPGPYTAWNTSKVTNMNNMFFNSTAFTQDISGWDISSLKTISNMFTGSGIQTNLDRTVNNNIWNAWLFNPATNKGFQPNFLLGAGLTDPSPSRM
jgi:hypothetical protein